MSLKTLDEFLQKWLGKQVEYHSYGSGSKYQCVDLVNQYIVEVLGLDPIIGTDAKDFSTRFNPEQFIFIQNSLLAIIKKGDIPVWINNVGGGAGHVAIALGGGLRKFTSLDQNWSVTQRITEEEHDYSNVSGWLRPKISNQELITLRKEVKALKQRVSALEDYDERWHDALKLFELPSNSKWSAFKSKVKSLFKDLKTTKEELETLKKAVANNVTELNMKKDGKYIYPGIDLISELIRRIRG